MIAAPNSKELENLALELDQRLRGARITRVGIPHRTKQPGGFFLNEWGIETLGTNGQNLLVLGARPNAVYLSFLENTKLKPAPDAKGSPFLQALKARLEGLRINRIWTPPFERLLVLEAGQYTFMLSLIPTKPEGLILNGALHGEQLYKKYEVAARSRVAQGNEKDASFFELKAPSAIQNRLYEIRNEFESLKIITQRTEESLDQCSFEERVQILKKELGIRLKNAQKQVHFAERAQAQARKDPDYQSWGERLKAELHEIKDKEDLVTAGLDDIELDPKLSYAENVSKFFELAKRNQRKHQENQDRLEIFGAEQTALSKKIDTLNDLKLNPDAWNKLAELETTIGLGSTPLRTKSKDTGVGKKFQIRGFTILIGRTRDENLELTLRVARGNDLWLHVKGRPSAHGIILIPPGKSVPLDILILAANLVIHYSKGADWGKTEVDYTYRKHVKRVPKSTEVTYSQNKTLVVQYDKKLVDEILTRPS